MLSRDRNTVIACWPFNVRCYVISASTVCDIHEPVSGDYILGFVYFYWFFWCVFLFVIEKVSDVRHLNYNNNIFSDTTGSATSKAIGPYWAAPLHPSYSQNSQNSLWIYDGVLSFIQMSTGSYSFTQALWKMKKYKN